MKKAYKIRLFGDFVFCEFDGKMAESIENKGFYRTQSKIATELIIEHCYFLFRSISTNCETNSISLSLNPVTSIFLVFVIPNK